MDVCRSTEYLMMFVNFSVSSLVQHWLHASATSSQMQDCYDYQSTLCSTSSGCIITDLPVTMQISIFRCILNFPSSSSDWLLLAYEAFHLIFHCCFYCCSWSFVLAHPSVRCLFSCNQTTFSFSCHKQSPDSIIRHK